ncbi:hypothetical protein EDD53_0561 [Pacificibacter maritimus]|uniref:Uncharacterized protein n=1 Tax=Pacificibacter maritimus TaxID=762213 RepID=A0A3N4ULG1_9RHOB|nr:hypothetical protein [Pacificibacter maritimus]RPE71442.1 hypothetical protein EDD53_0561 [Pacificibacter maritimus]
MNASAVDFYEEPKTKLARLMIHLEANDAGGCTVRYCELQREMFKNRTSFTETTQLEDAFTPNVAASIHDCLSRLSQENEVLSLNTFCHSDGNLTLTKAHVIARKAKDGVQRYMLRFNLNSGGLPDVLQPNSGLTGGLDGMTEQLSYDLLSDICMPMLDVVTALDLGLDLDADSQNSVTNSLRKSAMDIQFQIELIKRFLRSHQDNDNIEGLPTFQALPSAQSVCIH